MLSVVSPGGHRGRLSILIFHRVMPRRDPLFPEEVTRGEFDAICGWLKRWCNVLPLSEAALALKERRLPSRAVSITFDDGYADNHDHALPVLQQHGLTATFFVATGFLDGGRMWNDSLIEAIRGCKEDVLNLAGLPCIPCGSLSLRTNENRRDAIDQLLRAVKYLPTAQRDAAVLQICRTAQVELPNDLMLSSSQVNALSSAGMTIGAHTVTHPILQGMPPETVFREVVQSRQALSAITGRSVSLFAYPNGKPETDFDNYAVEAVRSAGFAAAVTTEWRPAVAKDDLFRLPRYTPWDREQLKFGFRLIKTLAAA